MIKCFILLALIAGIGFTWASWREQQNVSLKDVYKYIATICTSFIGLMTAFMLNANKTDDDKKDHLIKILNAEQTNLDRYGEYIYQLHGKIGAGVDSVALAARERDMSAYPFPALLDIRDPVIYDLDPDSYLRLGKFESVIKSALLTNSTRDPKVFLRRCLDPTFYAAVRYSAVIHWEYQFLKDSLTRAQVTDSSNIQWQAYVDTVNAHQADVSIP